MERLVPPRSCAALVLAGAIAVSACARGGGEAARSAAADSIPEGELVLPPSASAARAPQEGAALDTVLPAAPDDSFALEGTVGPVPPAVLDVGAVAGAYRRFYIETFTELGSPVRGNVDPELVEEAKRRTALEFGYVDADAWNDMLRDLSAEARAELAGRIATTNRALAQELHGAQAPRG